MESIDKCYLVGCFLIALGIVGCVIHRSLINILLCLELVFAGANLLLVTTWAATSKPVAYLVAMAAMVIAAVEIAVAIGIFILLYRRFGSSSAETLTDAKL